MVFSFNLKISSNFWELENTISSIDFECKVFSKTRVYSVIIVINIFILKTSANYVQKL